MSKNRYPSDAEIASGVRRFGNPTALARELGISTRSFLHHISLDEDRTALVEEAKADHQRALQEEADRLAAAAEPPPGEESDDDDDGPTEAEKLKQELAEATAQVRRLSKESVVEERIFERLRDYIPRAQTTYAEPAFNFEDGFDEHEFVLLFSDTHAGEIVSSEATLGMNSYDWDTMIARMQKMQRAVISYQRNRPYPIRKLWVGILGDMFSGDIHEELKITNDRTLDEAVVDLSHDIVAWLQGFKPYFDEIHVVCVPGNHPRRTQKPAAKLQQSNADWLMYQFVAALLAEDEQFSFNAPRSHYADAYICGEHHMLFMHGDGIRTTMPGVPWGGVVRRITTLQAQFAKAGQPIDYVGLGHFHTTNAIEGVGVKTFVNGSVKGVDEYSLSAFGSGQDPAQLLLTFHPEHGITDVSYLDLVPRRRFAR